MELSITLIIIIVTVAVSISAFSNQRIIDELIFYPPAVTNRNQWYRFITCGFIHADWAHLLFNMYAFYIFSAGANKSGVEYIYKLFLGDKGTVLFFAMYILALVACLLPTYIKHKDDYHYRSLGASGAVSAVVFTSILFYPTAGMGLLFIPVYVSGFIFGAIYLIVSSWLARKGHGNINHSAHIWGAAFGIIFTVSAFKAFGNYDVLGAFVQQIRNMDFSQLIRVG